MPLQCLNDTLLPQALFVNTDAPNIPNCGEIQHSAINMRCVRVCVRLCVCVCVGGVCVFSQLPVTSLEWIHSSTLRKLDLSVCHKVHRLTKTGDFGIIWKGHRMML